MPFSNPFAEPTSSSGSGFRNPFGSPAQKRIFSVGSAVLSPTRRKALLQDQLLEEYFGSFDAKDPGFLKFLFGSVKRSVATPITGVLETIGVAREGATAKQKASFEDLQQRYLDADPSTQRFLISLVTRVAADALPIIPAGGLARVGKGGAQLASRLGGGLKAQEIASGALGPAIEGALIGLGETADSELLSDRILGTMLGTTLGAGAGGLLRATRGRASTDPLDPETVKVVKLWKKWFSSKGVLPEKVFDAIGDARHEMVEGITRVGFRAADYNNVAKQYKVRHPDQDSLAIDDYLFRELEKPAEKMSYAEVADEDLRGEFLKIGREMRQEINATTSRLQDAGVVDPNSDLNTILNQGKSEAADKNYLARTFDAFSRDTSRKWPEHVFPDEAALARLRSTGSLADSEITGRAMAWDPVDERARPVFKVAYEFIKDELARDGIEASFDDTINFMHSIVTKGRDENVWKLMGGEIPKPFRNLFRKRKEVPDPILALLGEKRNPAAAYFDTVTRQVKALEDFKTVQAVKAEGEGKLFWRNAAEVPGGPATAVPISRLAERSGEAPLYTSPELSEILFGSGLKGAPGVLRFSNALAKQLKTVWSVQTQARNFIANPLLIIMNGHDPFTGAIRSLAKGGTGLLEFRIGKVVKGEKFGLKLAPGKAPTDAGKREFILDGIRHGVFGENVHFGDLEFYEQEVGRWLAQKDAKGAEKVFNRVKNGWLQRTVKGAYQLGDEYWKAILWEREIAQLRWAQPGRAIEEIKREAAEIVRNQMPTYSQVPKGVQELRKFPLVGTFVSFPAEIFRNFKNVTKRGMYEAFGDHGNARLRTLGVKRLAGVWAALALPGIGQQMLRHPEATAEREEAAKPLVAPWMRSSQLVMTRVDPKNKEFEVFDTSFMDPLSYLKKPFIRMLGSRFIDEEGTEELFKEFAETFFAPELATTAVVEVLMNKKGVPLLTGREGGNVWTPGATVGEIARSGAGRLARGLAPGTMTWAMRALRGAAGTKLGIDSGFNEVLSPFNRYGQKYELGREALALVGPRYVPINVPRALSFRSGDLRRAQKNAFTIWGREKSNAQSTPKRRQRARERAQKVWRDAFEDFQLMIKASRKFGMSNRDIMRLLDSNGISKTDARRLVMGVGARPLRLR